MGDWDKTAYLPWDLCGDHVKAMATWFVWNCFQKQSHLKGICNISSLDQFKLPAGVSPSTLCLLWSDVIKKYS